MQEATVDNQKLQIFEQFSIGIEGGALTSEREDFWISGNGRLLKRETTYGLLNPQSVLWTNTMIYKYDANIKIEVPIK